MTAPTPEQMRALADAADNLYREDQYDSSTIDDVVAALRAADDQLEAVQAVANYLRDERWDDPTFDPELRLRTILTADTAPQEATE